MDEKLTLKNLTFQILSFITDCISLGESCVAANYLNHNKLSEKAQDILKEAIVDFLSLRDNIEAYINKLRYYRDNHLYYEDNSLTDKFLTEVAATVRPKAQESLNILKRTEQHTKDEESRAALALDLDALCTMTNQYIDTIILFLNESSLGERLARLGVDYIEKYNLTHL